MATILVFVHVIRLLQSTTFSVFQTIIGIVYTSLSLKDLTHFTHSFVPGSVQTQE